MKNLVVRFISEEQGQDLIEYGLLVGIITTGAVTAITAIGPKVADYFADLNGGTSGGGLARALGTRRRGADTWAGLIHEAKSALRAHRP